MPTAFALRRAPGVVLRALVLWALVALVFWATFGLIPGIDLPSFRAALLATALVALINAALWPIVIRIVLPLTVLTFGVGSLILNAAVVMIAINLVDGDTPAFLAAVAAAFVLSVALMVLTPALSFDDDARQLRIVRRRARRVAEANRTEVPGVILFEIDGLAEPVLRRAEATTTCRPFAGTRRRAAGQWSPTTARTPPSSSGATRTGAGCWPRVGRAGGTCSRGTLRAARRR
jgi:putative membrane protein